MWPFDRFKNNDSDDVPPKPDDYSDYKRESHARYETTLEYRNGDTETLEHYGICQRDGSEILFNVEPYANRSWAGPGAYSKFKTISRSFEVLEREPKTEQVGEDTFELSWDVEHELKNERKSYKSTRWGAKTRNQQIEQVNGE